MALETQRLGTVDGGRSQKQPDHQSRMKETRHASRTPKMRLIVFLKHGLGRVALPTSPLQVARRLQKGMVTDCILPQLCLGEQGSKNMVKVVDLVVTSWAPVASEGSLGHTLSLAVEEVVCVCKFLKVLLASTSSPEDARSLALVVEASTGTKLIIKRVLPCHEKVLSQQGLCKRTPQSRIRLVLSSCT